MRKIRVWALTLVTTAALGGSLVLAGPAAAKPSGACPTSYSQTFTYAELVAIQVGLGNTGATAAPLQALDKNGDQSLCWKVLPQGANDPYVPVNVKDNTSK